MATTTELVITARDETREAFRSVESGLGRINSALGGMFAPLAALAGVAGFGALIKSQIDLGDQLNKTSQKLGIAVEDLSAYQYAAKLSDVSNEQLTGGLAKLAKTMQEAASNGTGPAAAAFRALGVNVTDATGNLRPLNNVLDEVSRRFEETSDGTNKTAMAMQLFGRSGAEMVPLLNSLRGLSEEAKRTGNIVSTEFAQKSEQFNDSMTRMEAAAGKLARHVASIVVPALATMLEKMNELIEGPQKATAAQKLAGITTQIETMQRVLANQPEGSPYYRAITNQIEVLRKQQEALKKEAVTATTAGGDKPGMASVAAVGIGDKEAEQTAKYQAELQKQIAALYESTAPQLEALAIKQASNQALLDEGYFNGLVSEQMYYEQSALLQAQYESKKTQIQQAEQKKRTIAEAQWMQQVYALQQQGFMGQLQGAGIMLGQMSQLMMSHKKKEFELGKKAAIGQALINTFLGVSAALSYGFPMGLIFAAIQLAVGMANVNRIRSQKFGDGGGATPTFNANPGTGIPEPIDRSTAEPIAPSLPGSQQATPQPRNVNINIASDSGVVSTAWLRDVLIPGLNDAVGDGVTLRTV